MTLFDCTLRDGANVLGNGFDRELTTMMIEGLLASGITDIEYGNSLGLGAYEANDSIAPLTDAQYLELVQPYLSRGRIGMFIGVANTTEETIAIGAKGGLNFLRIGANAGDGARAVEGIRRVKQAGMQCRYAAMKAYILTPEALAEEAKMLVEAGLDSYTIMDSAGTMIPHEVTEYVTALKRAVSIPIGFHGHNNLGLSVANALAAEEAGADEADCGLLGMARSAGNCATELITAALQKQGKLADVNLLTLLGFLDKKLAPAMIERGYRPAVLPLDLVFGYSGAHSFFTSLFKEVAQEKGVDLFSLIIQVSEIDRKAPSRALVEEIAAAL
jgi:4-hydroxy 2-oxovalerate aldolase